MYHWLATYYNLDDPTWFKILVYKHQPKNYVGNFFGKYFIKTPLQLSHRTLFSLTWISFSFCNLSGFLYYFSWFLFDSAGRCSFRGETCHAKLKTTCMNKKACEAVMASWEKPFVIHFKIELPPSFSVSVVFGSGEVSNISMINTWGRSFYFSGQPNVFSISSKKEQSFHRISSLLQSMN